MGQIDLSRELTGHGFHPTELARMTREGRLVHVRRGAYAKPDDQTLDQRAEHLRLVQATVRQSSPEAVVSHMSAAALHDLPVWTDQLARVSLTRDRRVGGGKQRRYSQIHGATLPEHDVEEIGGVRVTTLARTVLDLACALSMERSVPIGDAALRRGVDPAELAEQLDRASGRSGIRAARRSVMFFDGRSESPGESFSRVVFFQQGAPPPDLQFEAFGPAGELVGRSDFAWREQRTLGEFDGRVKYGRLLKPGQVEEVLFDEKVREDRLRELGWQIVRWIWTDLYQPARLMERLERAFARGRRAA